MVTETERQAIVDEEHLRLLPIAYWVLGGFDVFISLYGLIYVGFGALFALAPFESSTSASGPPPAFMGWFFFAFGLAFMLAFGISAAIKIAAGFWIRKRRRRTATFVVAAISCLSMPFGTMVGVLTFLVLSRPSVAALYERAAADAPRPASEAPDVREPESSDATPELPDGQ
jgi:hypothetical protein